MKEYIVQWGDTLINIANKPLDGRVGWGTIASLNNLSNDRIFVGQRLLLPDKAPSVTERLSHMAEDISETINSVLEFDSPPEPKNPISASLALARGFMFIVVEQLPSVGSGKIIRKVIAVPKNYALKPANVLGNLTPAEHVLNLNPSHSQFLSGSNKPYAAPTINGRPLLIDIHKIQAAGGKIYSVAEVVEDLKRFVAQNPSSKIQVEKLISVIKNIEGEMLISGSASPRSVSGISTPHNSYITSAEQLWSQFKAKRITRTQLENGLHSLEKAYKNARVFGGVGRGLMILGVVFTVADVANAASQSIEEKSFKPIAAESVRQVGGWGSAIAGGKVGFGVGALFGIETGPGAIVTGGIGAIIFGAAGYFGADWIADHISTN